MNERLVQGLAASRRLDAVNSVVAEAGRHRSVAALRGCPSQELILGRIRDITTDSSRCNALRMSELLKVKTFAFSFDYPTDTSARLVVVLGAPPPDTSAVPASPRQGSPEPEAPRALALPYPRLHVKEQLTPAQAPSLMQSMPPNVT